MRGTRSECQQWRPPARGLGLATLVALLGALATRCACLPSFYGTPCAAPGTCGGSMVSSCDLSTPGGYCTQTCGLIGFPCGSVDSPDGVCAPFDAGLACARGCPTPGCLAGQTCLLVADSGLGGCFPIGVDGGGAPDAG